jgi:hypothetical protein
MRRPDTRDATLALAPDDAREDAGDRLVLGRYRLERRLGAGGFGVVWQAHDMKLERDVAVKVVSRGDGELERPRVEREALAAARLNHPGIVALFEMGSDEHDVYLVSELVRGATLEELSRERAVSDRDVARIGAALCEALEHAHARGVIHRDVKPANVMVSAQPAAGAGFAKLTDFGIAHLGTGESLTATGDVVGTLAYMAPEQAEGRRVTPACDVYSLALTLYEAWTGVNPIRAASPAATARRLGRPLPPLCAYRPDLAPALTEAVDAALDPDPAYRPDPRELQEVLLEAQDVLSDEGGLVEPETVERFGLTAVRTRTRLHSLLHRRRSHPGGEDVPRRSSEVAARLAAGAAAGGLLALALATLGPTPPVSPATAGAVAALLVALLPRIGWIAAALALVGWLASPGADREGTALILAVALVPTPLLLPRAGLLWSVPVLAPLFGTIALAPLFVAVAALGSTAWRRAGLALAGFLWLAVAEILTGRELLFGSADGTLARTEWQDSVVDASREALGPLVSSPALAPAVVWVAFAVVLPLLVRGRYAPLDLVAACVWAAGLVAAHGALGDLLAATTELDQARGAVAGACLGAVVVLSATLLAPPVRGGTGDPALP